MKKFQFHMEKLLSYKGQMLDSEMMNLAVLNSMLSSALEKRKALESERITHEIEFEHKIKEQITPAGYGMYASYGKHMKDQIILCEKEVAEISEQIEKQIERVKNLKIETKSLETIKESRFMEYKKEDLKREELFVNEFVFATRGMRAAAEGR